MRPKKKKKEEFNIIKLHKNGIKLDWLNNQGTLVANERISVRVQHQL